MPRWAVLISLPNNPSFNMFNISVRDVIIPTLLLSFLWFTLSSKEFFPSLREDISGSSLAVISLIEIKLIL